jgi:hypothetical protein
MKRLALLLLPILLLTSCSTTVDSQNDEEIAELEERIAELETELAIVEIEDLDFVEPSIGLEAPDLDLEEVISVFQVTSPKNGAQYYMEDPIEFTGVVSDDVVSITVTAKYTEYELIEEYGKGGVNYSSEAVAKTDVYTLTGFESGDPTFTYRASHDWNNLGIGENTYIFVAMTESGVALSQTLTIENEAGGMGKPVIYLYPEVDQEVFVSVEPEGGLIVSAPEHGDGWTVWAETDGLLTDLRDGVNYDSLFWEGWAREIIEPEEGFVVASDEISTFFVQKLEYLGFTDEATEDFVEYWGDKLEESPYYVIRFVEQAELDRIAPLTIIPEPDTIIRMFFTFEELEAPISMQEPVLEAGVREGFTALEWGGPML